jgi:tetratricopeptide (TPR) repeat protein
MAKKKSELPEIGLENVEFEDIKHKGEEFFETNRNLIVGLGLAIILIVGGYFYYSRVYLPGEEAAAQDDMFMAVRYFEQDSLEKAINGYATYKGLADIVDEYGGTKSAEQAKYYLGVAYLKKGQFEDAIDMLSDYKAKDTYTKCVAIGATGDAHSELGNMEEALELYSKAAECNENELTTPIYLNKAGLTALGIGKKDQAITYFERIKNEYGESAEAREADKYLSMAKAQ